MSRMICEREFEELKEAENELWSMYINPKKAWSEIRELAVLGKLNEKALAAYIRYKRAKSQLIRCALDYVLGKVKE